MKLPKETWLGRAWPKSAAYPDCFGALRGSYFLALSHLRSKSSGREVEVLAPGSGIPVIVRLGTSDVQVFNDIYRRQAYRWDFGEPPKVIIDAGAYTGLSTSFFAARYPSATIIAVEPDEQNFNLLLKNTARFGNVRALRAALWMESGYVSLVDPGEDAWGLRVNESDPSSGGEAGPAPGPEPVRAVTVTDILREYDLERIDLLKIDVEGSEKEIFSTSEPWISSVEAICMELHDRFKAGCSSSFFRAVKDFPIELRRGEDVLVMRDHSRLGSLPEAVFT
jgi:FkbM family methyltransferase